MSLHLMDLLINSANAGATCVLVEIEEDTANDAFLMRVSDDGVGMDERCLSKALDPFFSSSGKKVGLGLPLVAQAARMAGGDIRIQSDRGAGTTVEVTARLSHPDLQPPGDVAGTIASFLAAHPNVRLVFRYRGPKGCFVYSTCERASCRSGLEVAWEAGETIKSGLAKVGFREHGGGYAVEVRRGPGEGQARDASSD